MAEAAPLPAREPVRGRHLLALPAGPGAEDLGVLAASRFASARWETPDAQAVREAGGAPLQALRLGRLSRLVGPYALDAARAAALGLPPAPSTAWLLECPVERGDPPWPGGDRDGLKRAFPGGMPVREEERAVTWLVAVARRLRGAVQIAGTGTGAGAAGARSGAGVGAGAAGTGTATVLTPDPGALVDLVLYTNRWLEPAEALATVRTVVRRARPSGSADRFLGSEDRVDPGLRTHLARFGVRDEVERTRLAAEAAAYDAYMLTHPPAAHGYGIEADLDVDGFIAVEVSGQDEVPMVLASLPWTSDGVVAYRVRWEPEDLTEQESERPSLAHRVARGRAAPQVRGVARALQAVLGGAVLDEAEFPVDPSAL